MSANRNVTWGGERSFILRLHMHASVLPRAYLLHVLCEQRWKLTSTRAERSKGNRDRKSELGKKRHHPLAREGRPENSFMRQKQL